MLRNNIAKIRKVRGLSQTDLATNVGTTLNMIGKLERGDRPLNSDWIVKISFALEVEPHVLIAPERLIDEADAINATEEMRARLPSGDRLIAAMGAALTASGRADLVDELAVKLARFLPTVLSRASAPLRNDPNDAATHADGALPPPAKPRPDKQ